MFGDFSGQSQFGSNIDNYKSQAAAGDNTAFNKLIGLGASGYGAEDQNTKDLAYNSWLGNSGYAPSSGVFKFLSSPYTGERVMNRLYNSAAVDNPSLHMPDFLKDFDLHSFIAASSAADVGRQAAYQRYHTNY